ncbi:MAG: hypothetical protein J3K34DRAFT_409082 [Monoraphidium minutum]|nr:MAG: hypothetical protein J3K34DRAFT_409082 [Monoraphidium minutum]
MSTSITSGPRPRRPATLPAAPRGCWCCGGSWRPAPRGGLAAKPNGVAADIMEERRREWGEMSAGDTPTSSGSAGRPPMQPRSSGGSGCAEAGDASSSAAPALCPAAPPTGPPAGALPRGGLGSGGCMPPLAIGRRNCAATPAPTAAPHAPRGAQTASPTRGAALAERAPLGAVRRFL